MKLSFKIKRPVDFVLDYLTDMQKFVLVHPVITKVNSVGHNKYLIYETLKVGFIPISFTYPATIIINKVDKVVVISATIMGFAKVEIIFRLIDVDGITLIKENIYFESFLLVKYFMKKIFRKQHAILFKNIEREEVTIETIME